MASHKLGESFIQELSSAAADTDAVIEAALSCFTLAELQHAYAIMVGGTDTDTHVDSDSLKCTDSAVRAILNVMPSDQGEDADSPAPQPAPTAAAAGAGAAPSPTPTPSSPAAPQPAPTAPAAGVAAAAPSPTPSSPAPAPAPATATVATSTATPAAAAATTKVKAVVGVSGSGPVVSVTPNNRGDGSPTKRYG